MKTMEKMINPRRKWFKTLREAKKAFEQRVQYDHTIRIIHGVKGSRHPKEWFVGHYIEFINIY